MLSSRHLSQWKLQRWLPSNFLSWSNRMYGSWYQLIYWMGWFKTGRREVNQISYCVQDVTICYAWIFFEDRLMIWKLVKSWRWSMILGHSSYGSPTYRSLWRSRFLDGYALNSSCVTQKSTAENLSPLDYRFESISHGRCCDDRPSAASFQMLDVDEVGRTLWWI